MLCRSLSPRYVDTWNYQELGRSCLSVRRTDSSNAEKEKLEDGQTWKSDQPIVEETPIEILASERMNSPLEGVDNHMQQSMETL